MIDSRLLIHDPATGTARPVIPGDIAILSRSWGPLDVYGNALSAHGIPAVNMGGVTCWRHVKRVTFSR
jgi:ATP-dependent helicase/nuclease subunit A